MIRHHSDVYSLGGNSYALSRAVYRLRNGGWTAMPNMTHARSYFALKVLRQYYNY